MGMRCKKKFHTLLALFLPFPQTVQRKTGQIKRRQTAHRITANNK
ncbi:hypothetical protein T11_8141 [Trichinella zimbabwensis]|uniref:Uncharacterized protein n=1 Tax=Trichinella zimbabwensis TaxID=268475 RepID=A0A0V1GJQ1_9BILA|nr:hypothetical protein T11_8141 [Trichinella zimbabwensis]